MGAVTPAVAVTNPATPPVPVAASPEPLAAAATAPAPDVATASLGEPVPLNAAEVSYARSTAGAVFRHRGGAERATTFVPAGSVDGYGICLRAPAAKGGGYAYALIVLDRRLSGGAISQVDDETAVMRRPADTRVCREPALSFVSAAG